MPLIRSYPQATTLEETDAFVIDRIGTGTMFIEAEDLVAPYLATFEFLGDPALADEILGAHPFPTAAEFPVDFAGAVGFCDPASLPTADFVAKIYQIVAGVSTQIGTMTIDTAGAFTFAVPLVTTFAAGDSIKYLGPSVADDTAGNFWWSILGALV